MMGTHGPMVTVIPSSLRSALMQLKKKLNFFFKTFRNRLTPTTTPRHFCHRNTLKQMILSHS